MLFRSPSSYPSSSIPSTIPPPHPHRPYDASFLHLPTCTFSLPRNLLSFLHSNGTHPPSLVLGVVATTSWARADLARNRTPTSALSNRSGRAVVDDLLRRLEAAANPSRHWLPARLPPVLLASSTSWPRTPPRPPSRFFCRLRLMLWSWIPVEERLLASLSLMYGRTRPFGCRWQAANIEQHSRNGGRASTSNSTKHQPP